MIPSVKRSVLARTIAPLLLFVPFNSCQAQQPEDHTSKIERFLSEAHSRGQFNGAALVYADGKVIHECAFGIRSIDPMDSLDVNSRFRLASVSKQFTAMAIMLLMEQGKLKYDQDIRDFLPELPYAGMTIRHLLHHTSGLPEYEPMMDQHWKPELKYNDPARYSNGNADVIKMLVELKPPVLFKPGEQWAYSNTGYNLLGTIVARASGMSFAEYTQKYIFDPAGMSHSSFYDFVIGTDPKMPDRAYGFVPAWNGTDLNPADSHYLNLGMGEDGVYSTVGDLLKWDRILYTDKLVATAIKEEAYKPGVLNNGDTTDYGFGWHLERSPTGKRVVSHSGGWLSFTTFIYRAIDEDKCFVVLMNNSSKYFWPIVEGVKSILYDSTYALPALSIREVLGKDIAENGVEHAIALYRSLKAERASEFHITEGALNILGYELLWADRVDDAVAILKLTVEEYPNSANVYDSYGDALLAKGDTVNALANFKKAFAMDATMTVTKEKIDGMEKDVAPKGK